MVRPAVSSPWLRRIRTRLSAISGDEPLALVEIEGDAFVIVIGDAGCGIAARTG